MPKAGSPSGARTTATARPSCGRSQLRPPRRQLRPWCSRGRSQAEDRALAFILAGGGGKRAQRIDDRYLAAPLPDPGDHAYVLNSLTVGEYIEELHAALALNPVSASRRGAFQLLIAIDGEVLMVGITRVGHASHVMLNLSEEALAVGAALNQPAALCSIRTS